MVGSTTNAKRTPYSSPSGPRTWFMMRGKTSLLPSRPNTIPEPTKAKSSSRLIEAPSDWKLRWPASVPFLVASLKVAIAISLVGAIVGELPTGATAGLGARLLTGSYYGQTVQIWSALLMAALLGCTLVFLIGLIERLTLTRMGARR